MNYKHHHAAISVRNLENSLKFYQDLGYEEVHRWIAEDESLTIVHLKLSDAYLEIFWYAKNAQNDPLNYEYANNLEDIGVKHIALQVENLEEALGDLRVKGHADDSTKVKQGRTNVRYFFIKDPDDVWVEIIEDKRGY